MLYLPILRFAKKIIRWKNTPVAFIYMGGPLQIKDNAKKNENFQQENHNLLAGPSASVSVMKCFEYCDASLTS